MSLYMKSFVYAALFYLGLAVILGVLNGVTDLGNFGYFAHSHLNLLGFMAMIIFGIGYFILPRFNGTELRFESWIPVHFYLGNISLIGMILFRGLFINTGEDIYHILFIIMASVQALSIFMFIVNIWITLTPKKITGATLKSAISKESTTSSDYKMDSSTMPNIPVTPDTEIGYLVDRLPSLQQTFIDNGLLALQMPGHIDKVKQMGITIETAANNHGLNLDNLILAVETELRRNGFTTSVDIANLPETNNVPSDDLSTSVLIGDIISRYPDSKATFQKYFGDGCFDCPGQSYESIDMACRMHGVDPEQFLKELKTALK